MPWLVTTEQVIERKPTSLLLDGRGEVGFCAGHIPGAVSIPFRSLLGPATGLFKDDASLEAVFDSKAVDWRNRPVITSCGAGYAGTVVLLALKKLGRDAPLYDGSFTVWKQDPDRPIEQRAERRLH